MKESKPNKRLYITLILFLLAIVALDQLSKHLVVRNIPFGAQVPLLPGVVHLTYVRNTGAAFSMLSGARWLFLGLVVVFLTVVVSAVFFGALEAYKASCVAVPATPSAESEAAFWKALTAFAVCSP